MKSFWQENGFVLGLMDLEKAYDRVKAGVAIVWRRRKAAKSSPELLCGQ